MSVMITCDKANSASFCPLKSVTVEVLCSILSAALFFPLFFKIPTVGLTTLVDHVPQECHLCEDAQQVSLTSFYRYLLNFAP
jgi:hypothetical protein